jgi:hypothetical protein
MRKIKSLLTWLWKDCSRSSVLFCDLSGLPLRERECSSKVMQVQQLFACRTFRIAWCFALGTSSVRRDCMRKLSYCRAVEPFSMTSFKLFKAKKILLRYQGHPKRKRGIGRQQVQHST